MDTYYFASRHFGGANICLYSFFALFGSYSTSSVVALLWAYDDNQ